MNAKRAHQPGHNSQLSLSLEGLEDLLERPALMLAEKEQNQVHNFPHYASQKNSEYILEIIRQMHEMQDMLTVSGAYLTTARKDIAHLQSLLTKQSKSLAYHKSQGRQLAKLLTLAVLEIERLKSQWLCRSWLK